MISDHGKCCDGNQLSAVISNRWGKVLWIMLLENYPKKWFWFGLLLAIPKALGSSWARDQTHASAATWAAAVRSLTHWTAVGTPCFVFFFLIQVCFIGDVIKSYCSYKGDIPKWWTSLDLPSIFSIYIGEYIHSRKTQSVLITVVHVKQLGSRPREL